MTVPPGSKGIPQASAAEAQFMEITLAIKARLMMQFKLTIDKLRDGITIIKLKPLADQFVHQIKAAAHFKMFWDDQQKILWAQLYLSESAQDWYCVITTGIGNPKTNSRCFSWKAWLDDFRAGFCMWDPEQNTLTCIGELNQGSKSIMDYCIAYFELKGKLGLADANSEYIKNCF
ncbi:hypothetical protein C0995_005244 [Termitomyces sp. Mi166|nr:hypothetical protein C0995_005244 [Termitomyces sp. Mi166\